MKNSDVKRATLKTIADRTGVSVSTVSLCMRDGSHVKAATRELIQQAAKELGYVPNRAGVRLRTGRTNVIALVLATDKNSVDYTRQLIHGIGTQISGTAFHLSVIPEVDPSDPLAAVRYILETHSADAVILTYTSVRDPRVQMLMDAEFPFVCHGRTEFFSPHPYFDFNAEKFIEMSVERLISKGRKHIHLTAVNNQTTNYTHIVNAFLKTTARLGVISSVTSNPKILDTPGGARDHARDLPRQYSDIDAIITNNELTGLALISGLNDVNYRLGSDYDLICKSTTDILPTLYPDMDTVAEDLVDTGKVLARLTMQRIDGVAAEQLQYLQKPVSSWSSSSPNSHP